MLRHCGCPLSGRRIEGVSERSCKYAKVTGLTRRHVLECLAGSRLSGREEEKDVSKGKDLPGAHQYYSFGKSSAFARKGTGQHQW